MSALVSSLSLLPGLAMTASKQDAWLEASRPVPKGLTVARLDLRTKCYGPMTECEGPYKGESDV